MRTRSLLAEAAPESLNKDEALVMRQALAGMVWSKQFYYDDVAEWLREHGHKPEEGVRAQVRNKDWFHMSGLSGRDTPADLLVI